MTKRHVVIVGMRTPPAGAPEVSPLCCARSVMALDGGTPTWAHSRSSHPTLPNHNRISRPAPFCGASLKFEVQSSKLGTFVVSAEARLGWDQRNREPQTQLRCVAAVFANFKLQTLNIELNELGEKEPILVALPRNLRRAATRAIPTLRRSFSSHFSQAKDISREEREVSEEGKGETQRGWRKATASPALNFELALGPQL